MRKDTTSGSSRRDFMQQSGGIALTAALASYLGESAIATAQTTPSDRVTNLVDEMTLEEKVGQMTQMAASEVSSENPAEALRKYKPGSLMYLPSFDPEEVARESDVRQKAMVEDTRLGVPFVYGIDSVHGNNNIEGATIFPHNHGVGATWDADAAEEMASITSRTMRVTGTHWNFSPVADLQRDPRWGRFYEGFSEDPYLASRLVASKVRGYEEETNGYKRTGASVKHFAGYSAPENGNDRTSALLPYRTFVSTFLPPYGAGITAGAETVMVNSGSLNGVPAHASKELLTDILRDQLGFEGMVVTDWHDFYRMIKVHGFAEDLKEATRLGINAGIDMYMVPAAGIEGDDAEGYQQRLIELVDEGSVSMERIDDAVTNVLAFKENLGLFENPYAEPSKVEDVVSEGRDLARDVATESMTLLTNDGTLPLGSDAGSILVTGPSADSVANQMGGWSLGWQGVGDTEPPATTVLDGISEAASGASVTHVPTGLHEFSNEESVRDAAECADVVVAVLGEGPYAEEQGDTDTLALPDAQRRLVKTVAEMDTPTVGVIMAGRPRGTSVFDHLSASLMAYLPGTAAGPAVAATLFGDANPSGRLPFTWPTGTGQLPNVHNNFPPDEFNAEGNTDPPRSHETPLFPFGHGMSYTEFEYSDLEISPTELPQKAATDDVTVSVTVQNTGDTAGETVVPVYGGREHGEVMYPQEVVVGFERVSLDAGETARVDVRSTVLPLANVLGDVFSRGELVVDTGDYWLSVGDMTESLSVV
ncbi:glycoside hydrolase family 3 N-terminal domain-containing protein [Haladaptatus sp. DYF46]|uniref:glycoside hydrolase family 3 N-terminal domain-containing protein n=1 Tax=Haladaptatus sp. DYF46 TaxID=2886041 RepID=UPI001E2DA93A|nr:glycoside hydrolase family 3 N-terminal domain-containing protein [Haladaptatus sp. DYF46]